MQAAHRDADADWKNKHGRSFFAKESHQCPSRAPPAYPPAGDAEQGAREDPCARPTVFAPAGPFRSGKPMRCTGLGLAMVCLGSINITYNLRGLMTKRKSALAMA